MDRTTVGTREVVEKLRELAKRLGKAGLRIESMVLIGSYAYGNSLKESDIDVIIVSEDFQNKPFYDREAMILRYWSYEKALEPWYYTPSEVEEALKNKPRIDLIDAIERGIIIYDRGFWEEIQKKYHRKPYRRTAYGGVKLR